MDLGSRVTGIRQSPRFSKFLPFFLRSETSTLSRVWQNLNKQGRNGRPRGSTPYPGFARKPAARFQLVVESIRFLSCAQERRERLRPKNTRKYPRIKTVFPIEYTLEKETFQGEGSILGGGGLFLGTQTLLAAGTEIVIGFRPAKHLPVIRAKAKVCYQVPGQGVALEFTDISAQQREMLLRLIHRKTHDKRNYPRASLATQVQCQECMTLAFSRDVSPGGMFIDTKKPLPVGSRLNLRFNLEDGGPVVVAVAEVTYEVAKLGMGIQFLELAPADRKRVEVYVVKNPVRA